MRWLVLHWLVVRGLAVGRPVLWPDLRLLAARWLAHAGCGLRGLAVRRLALWVGVRLLAVRLLAQVRCGLRWSAVGGVAVCLRVRRCRAVCRLVLGGFALRRAAVPGVAVCLDGQRCRAVCRLVLGGLALRSFAWRRCGLRRVAMCGFAMRWLAQRGCGPCWLAVRWVAVCLRIQRWRAVFGLVLRSFAWAGRGLCWSASCLGTQRWRVLRRSGLRWLASRSQAHPRRVPRSHAQGRSAQRRLAPSPRRVLAWCVRRRRVLFGDRGRVEGKQDPVPDALALVGRRTGQWVQRSQSPRDRAVVLASVLAVHNWKNDFVAVRVTHSANVRRQQLREPPHRAVLQRLHRALVAGHHHRRLRDRQAL
jgi:hypothetical protein